MKSYSILVNTCDSFEDCWEPFFRLWSLYWPDCPARVYLNTEYKTYSGPEKNVVSLRSCAGRTIPGRRRATWSECLKWALEAMETDTVLYMQEDYFLTAPVDGRGGGKIRGADARPSGNSLHSVDAGGNSGPRAFAV